MRITAIPAMAEDIPPTATPFPTATRTIDTQPPTIIRITARGIDTTETLATVILIMATPMDTADHRDCTSRDEISAWEFATRQLSNHITFSCMLNDGSPGSLDHPAG